ncbi:hypothetical protein Bca101_067560 [Brassica carinata]
MDSAASPSSSEPPGIDRKVQDAAIDGMKGIDTDLKKEKQSWASVAKEKKVLKKFEVEITSKDGKNKVVFPDDIVANSTPLWEDFVVGKFLEIAPHIAKVHMVVNKIWSYGDSSSKVDVYDVNAKTMRFKIPNPKAREKVIKRGMWNIAGVPMVVKKWTPSTEEEKQEEEAIPMWVHLRKIPLNTFSWEALSFMMSTVGFPVHLHPETIACSNFEEAKVFVKVDVSKTLPKEIDFSLGGQEFTAEFYYPWLPSRCNLCDKWGHTEMVCGKRKRERMVQENGNNGGSQIKSGKVVEANVVEESQFVKEDTIETAGSVVSSEEVLQTVVLGSLEKNKLRELLTKQQRSPLELKKSKEMIGRLFHLQGLVVLKPIHHREMRWLSKSQCRNILF